MIAPEHDPIWRQDLDRIIGYYAEWAEQRSTNKAVVVYDTMWNSTETMAKAVVDGLLQEGVATKLMKVSPRATCSSSAANRAAYRARYWRAAASSA